MRNSSGKLHVVYTIPVFSQEPEGLYARFHDVIHTLQRMKDPPWDYTIVPMRRYKGEPSADVLFRNGGSRVAKLVRFLRNVAQASREADIVHVVEGQFPYSAMIPFAVKRGVPLVAGPNVALGIDRSLKLRYWGEGSFSRLGLSIHDQNKLVFHRRSPLSLRYKRVFMFEGYAQLAVRIGGLSEAKLVVMPSGVRTDIFRLSGEMADLPAGFNVLYLGDPRRNHIKGFDVFLGALRHLVAWGFDFHAYILSRVDPGMQEAVDRCGLGDKVTMLGFVQRSRVAAYYRSADVYVCSSRYEADSTTAVEALACGTPVVGTEGPGINSSLAFEMGSADCLAGALMAVYENRRDYRLAAREGAGWWGMEAIINKWHEVYREIAK